MSPPCMIACVARIIHEFRKKSRLKGLIFAARVSILYWLNIVFLLRKYFTALAITQKLSRRSNQHVRPRTVFVRGAAAKP